MKRFWPLLLALVSCLVFTAMIFKNQWQLKHSQAVYIQLQPVDPRSLIQGDYMQLNYDLHWFGLNATAEQLEKLSRQIQNRQTVISYVLLDQSGKVVATSLDQQMLAASEQAAKLHDQVQALKLKNPTNSITGLYPSSNSFLFAEGLASCYDKASYAKFMVDEQGNAILADLVNDKLNSLNCKAGQSWWKN